MFHPEGPTFWELAEQALSSTDLGYDLLAPKFDHTPFRTPDEILRELATFVEGELNVQRGLDLCCGTGAVIEHLRPVCRFLVGMDRSQGMLGQAQEKLSGAPAAAPRHANVELVRGDVLEPPFVEAFDLATCFGGLGHIPIEDEERFVMAVRQTLVPGGHFVFASGSMPPFFSASYWITHGFNVAMRLRNLVWSPPFIMYYLTFLLPDSKVLLERCGFRVAVMDRIFPTPFERLQLVVATKQD